MNLRPHDPSRTPRALLIQVSNQLDDETQLVHKILAGKEHPSPDNFREEQPTAHMSIGSP